MPRQLRRLLSGKFLARVWIRANEDEIFGRCAQLSYYFLLSLFPLLFFLTTLFGYFASAPDLQRKLMTYLSSVVPASAVQLVRVTFEEVIASRGGGKLSLGLLAALWAASSGINALGEALNAAYGVSETRSWWKVRLISVGLTVALAVLIVSALLIVLYGGKLGQSLFNWIDEGDPFSIAWKILQWPIALTFVFLAFGLLYQFAPNLSARRRGGRLTGSDYRRRWLSPGVFVAVFLWLLVSLGFRLYLHFFNSYSATYGSLGALIILMLWFYLTGAAILLGAEVNCELESGPRTSR